jgi:hypothetical protein
MAIAVQARLSKYIADFYLSRRLLFIPYQNAQKRINGKTFLKIEKERLSKQIHNRIRILAGFDLGTKPKINYISEKCVLALANLQID